MAAILLLCFLSINLQFAFSANCLKYDTDFNGPNINNGLEQRTSTAEDCQTLCCATMGCNGFTWASGEFFGKIVPNIRSIISRWKHYSKNLNTVSSRKWRIRKWRFSQIGGYHLVTPFSQMAAISRRLAVFLAKRLNFFVKLNSQDVIFNSTKNS